MPHLDVYDENVVDDEDYEAMTAETRAAAEREMRKRDRQEALSQGRMRPDLLYGKHSNYNYYYQMHLRAIYYKTLRDELKQASL